MTTQLSQQSAQKHARPRQNRFANTLLEWFDQHGRKTLPWQKPITPYRVWLSEIMLQQTQVETVIPYFNRFIQRFPTIAKLAAAAPDDVLHMWTGLGYYARARNLHKCAQTIEREHQGNMPSTAVQLQQLPGIGRSTAGAIASIAFNQATAILDGNVKRVLTRYHAIAGWTGNKKVEDALWHKATQHMPQTRCADYTQAIMDLGALVCTRTKPNCAACPLKRNCQARKLDCIADFPGKKPKKTLPTKYVQMLIIKNGKGEILLEKRPPQGIWGGLWSLPELPIEEDGSLHCLTNIGPVQNPRALPSVKHTFSHFHLAISPLQFDLVKNPQAIGEGDTQMWYNLGRPQKIGLAAPVKKLLALA